MTNREWLATLSDKELAEWLCDSLMIKDKNTETYRYYGVGIEKSKWSHSVLGLTDWLSKDFCDPYHCEEV